MLLSLEPFYKKNKQLSFDFRRLPVPVCPHDTLFTVINTATENSVCSLHWWSDQGGHKVGEKKSPSFPGFARAIIILFQRLSQQKFWRFGSIQGDF